jgi:hypothetical protein
MESTINAISPTINAIVQMIAFREGGGPSSNTLTPNGTNAMQRPSNMNVDSNLVPLRVPNGRKNMELKAIERMIPNVPER